MKKIIATFMLIILIVNNLCQATEAIKPMKTNGVIIFVSLSMPRQSLVAIMRDANRIGGSVVMRGLVNDSFKQTFQEISNLVQEAKGGGIELNPMAFKRFQVTKVPTFVAILPSHPCLAKQQCNRENDYDVISGNLTLEAALSEMSQRGKSAPNVANTALMKLQGKNDA